MAIRPVDLQLAYMAAPASAAAASQAQNGPAIAQQSAAAAFAAAVHEREETVAANDDVDRAQMRMNSDREADPNWSQNGKKRHAPGDQAENETPSDGEIHFIDTSA